MFRAFTPGPHVLPRSETGQLGGSTGKPDVISNGLNLVRWRDPLASSSNRTGRKRDQLAAVMTGSRARRAYSG